MLSAAVQGFLVSGALIVAIGAQNAFVLRMGLARRHVGLVVAVCAICDALLIIAGVAGFGSLVRQHEAIMIAVGALGVAFLASYGVLSLRRALQRHALTPAAGVPTTRRAALQMALAFTLLNPHVYLDTVVLIGGYAAQFDATIERAAFAAGACTASVTWFTALGYGSRALAPVFGSARAWRILDTGIGLVMLTLAGLLAASTWQQLG